MKFRDLLENDDDHMHQMPVDHLHAETHVVLSDAGYDRHAIDAWERDQSYHGVPSLFRDKLHDLGYKKGSRYAIPGRHVTKWVQEFRHPNGSVLRHVEDEDFMNFTFHRPEEVERTGL